MLHSRDKWRTLVVQLSSACVALAAAWLLRFDFSFPYPRLVLVSLPILVGCRWALLSGYRLTHHYWRYTGIGDLADLVKATVGGSVLFFLLSRLASGNRPFPQSLPLSIYVLEGILSFLLLSGLRVSAAMLLQARAAKRGGDRTEILIVGAGFAGAMLLKALRGTKYEAVGLLDDDPALQATKLCGVPVLGRIDRLPEAVAQYGVKEVLIAIPSASGAQMLRITDFCTRAGVAFRAVPSVSDLIDGKVAITELRELNLDDLLGRDPVRLESEEVRTCLQGQVVMVTGAAGSIGSELCRQIVRNGPAKLICVDQAETPLFHLEQRMLADCNIEVVYAVSDVGDTERMQQLLIQHRVRIIFHAAAYKHVPMIEVNPYEGLKNNVFSLLDFVEIAEECGCEHFLLISSDKAVKPSSLMGCTKRLGEMIVGSRRQQSMRCVSVRFGNVLGSQGSVIPVFREQIRDGRPLTVTHPEATRYFMTIPEAVSLTLQAFTIGEHGDVLVLDMGEPVLILDLAKTLIRISGKSEEQVPITFTGLRPGEKLHEELFYDSETRLHTVLTKVMRAQSKQTDWLQLQRDLRDLEMAAHSQDDYQIRCKVKEIIPEYEWTPTKHAAMALVPRHDKSDFDMTAAWPTPFNEARKTQFPQRAP